MIAAVSQVEYMTQILSPAPKFVTESLLHLIPDGDRLTAYEAIKQQLTREPGASDFTVAMPGFTPTTVEFHCLPTAAMAMFCRARHGSAPAGDMVGAAFIFVGRNAADEEEALRRTAGGRDANGQPYPIPAHIYEKIRAQRIRPLLALLLWDGTTANDPSLLAIAQAIASVFFESCAK